MMLDHERLDVYQCAIRLVAAVLNLLAKMPKGHAQLADQLRRAAFSIPLNIAEGAGKVTPRDRSRFHAIARGSAMECGAILDIIALLDVPPAADIAPCKALLVRIVSMLSKMGR
jgi:four helix bundle protein